MLSPLDRDMIIRTIIGEAAGEPDDGQAAVAGVILNRMRSGKYGGTTGTDVVLHPHQFEAWDRPGKLLAYGEDSPEYSKASAALDAAMANDPSGGATNFLNKKLQTDLGRKIPDWAAGDGQQIGNHTFYGGTKVASNSDDPFADIFEKGATAGDAPDAEADDPFSDIFGGATKPAVAEAVPAPRADGVWSNTGRAFAGGVVKGIPVLGPILMGGMEKGLAGLKSSLSDESFADALKRIKAQNEADATEHPIAEGAGEFTGGTLALAAGGATGIGAKALGIVGKSLKARTAASTATGAMLGGTDAAVRHGADSGEVLRGAAFGGGFGAVAPVAGDLIGAGANKLVGALREMGSPAKRAGNSLLDVYEAGGRPIADIEAELASNPRLAPVDVDPNLKAQAMGIATQIGEGRTAISDAVEARIAGQKGTVRQIFDDAIDKTPDVKVLVDKLENTARDNARVGFGEAFKDADAVDLTEVLKHMDDKIAPGAMGVVSPGSSLSRGVVADELSAMRAEIANAREQITDPQRLHEIQSEWRRTGQELMQKPETRRLGRAILNARAKLVDAIDEAAGGKYKPAQARYKDDMQVREAFTKGMDIFKNRAGEKGLDDRPEYWADWAKNAAPEELDAVRQGVRVAIDQATRGMRWAARKGTDLVEPELNQEKLALLFGTDEAKAMAKQLKDELKINQTNVDLLKGAQTAPRLLAAKSSEVRDWSPKGQRADATAVGLAVAGLKGTAKFIGGNVVKKADNARNRLVAEALMDPEKFSPALRDAMARKTKRETIHTGVGAATNILTQGQARRKQPLRLTVTGANPQ